MGSADLIRSCLDSIRQISDEVADAVVYIDAGCLEAFQFLGAFSLLLELRVRAVCSLENMSPLDIVANWNSISTDTAKKIVVITSRLLSDAHRYILRCLSTHQTVLKCSIFTSISEASHSAYINSPLGPDAFREYESLLFQDYDELIKKSKNKKLGFNQVNEGRQSTEGNRECIPNSGVSYSVCTEADGWPRLVISVHHFPMIFCPLSPRVFVLPSEGTIAEACLSNDHEDSLSPGLPPICTGLPSDGDDIPPGAILTAHFIYHLAAKMDLKIEIFSLGDLSKAIGKILTDMSSLYDVGRRNKRSAGLLIIDRSLDLLTPCSHGDSVVDWMLSSLPRRERTTSSSHVKGSQLPNKHTPTHVLHAPLDVRIPLGKIFSKEGPPTVSDQLSENITAFISGWNSCEIGDKTADLSDHREVQSTSSMDHEYSLLSGSFVSYENYMGANCLEALLERRIKDGVILINKWLLETLHHDKVSVNLKGYLPTASDLHSMAKLLASNQMSLIRNKGIIQLAIGAEVALSEPHNSHWNAFVSAERILKMSTGDTSQSLSSQICDLINASILVRSDDQDKNTGSQGLISFQDALILAITGYILAGETFPTSGSTGPFSWEEEHSLKEAVVDAILDKPASTKLRFLHGLEEELEANFRKGKSGNNGTFAEPSNIEDFDDRWGNWDDEDSDHNNEQVYGDVQLKLELRDRVDHLFKFFHKISGLKWRNPSFRDLESKFGSDMYNNKGLLCKLLTMVLAKYDIPGLEYHSSAVGRFFKSGFGRFGLGQAKPSLGDQSVLLVFVVGGINGLEVREVQEAISESAQPDVELILGGTTLLTPDDMFELLLGSSIYI